MGWGQQTKEGPCYKFLRINRNIYHIELSLKVFICKKYNGMGADDVNVICNGWK